MNLDAACLSWFQAHHPLFLLPLMKGISALFTSELCCLWAGLIAVALMSHHHFIRASILFFGTALASVLVELIKMGVARNRPPLSGIYDSYSFPSGHALSSTVFFGLLAWTLSHSDHDRRNLFYALATAMTLAVGISRLYLGVHWLTDVLGGFVIGFVFLRSWLWMSKSILIREETMCQK